MAKVGRPKLVEEAIDKLATLKRCELEDARTDRRLGSELGRLYRADKIESVHFLAGEAIATLAERYMRAKGLQIGRPKANLMEPRAPGATHTDFDDDYVRNIEAEFDRAFESMKRAEKPVVYDVCVNNEHCPHWGLEKLKEGLKAASPWLKLR